MTIRNTFAGLFLTWTSVGLFGQDTLIIPEAIVQSNFSETPEAAPRNLVSLDAEVIAGVAQPSLDGLLESVPGVDARQRGPMGVQTDLSIRGGSFEQVALWVDGIRWSAPHTGHHLLNLPLDPEDIQRIRIVRGGSGALGSGGMTGGVIINTEPDNSNGAEASFEAGSYGWNRSRFRIDWGKTSFRHRFSISRAATTGYRANTDMVMQRFRYAGKTVNDLGTWNIRAGHLSSAFGAQDFYTANFPQQFEQVGLWQGQLTWNRSEGPWHWEAGVHYRNHQDRFELFREGDEYYAVDTSGTLMSANGPAPSWYQGANQHRSATLGARVNTRRSTNWGQTLFSVDARREQVVSNRLGSVEFGVEGDSIFTLGDRRTHVELTAGQRFQKGHFTANALANWTLNSAADGPRFTPEASLSWSIDDNGRTVAFASARRSMRMPSFTDLYYTVGGAQGSQDLMPEEADHLELGYRITADLSETHRLVFSQHLFHRWGRNLIDWVRFNGSSITQATNLRAVHFTGQELSLSARATSAAAHLRYLTVSLAFINADETSQGFESNYVLDILQSKADVWMGWRLAEQFVLDLRWSAQDRNGGYFDPVQGAELAFDPVHLIGTTVRWTSNTGNFEVHARMDNALGAQYVDIGNVDQPGRWVRAGITWKLNKKSAQRSLLRRITRS
jgi:vitamin B12 transporter